MSILDRFLGRKNVTAEEVKATGQITDDQFKILMKTLSQPTVALLENEGDLSNPTLVCGQITSIFEQGYRHPTVFAVVNMIAREIQAIEFKIEQGGKELTKEEMYKMPLYEVLMSPNSTDNWNKLIQKLVINYLVFGFAGLHTVTSTAFTGGDKVRDIEEIQLLPARTMWVELDKTTAEPKRYDFLISTSGGLATGDTGLSGEKRSFTRAGGPGSSIDELLTFTQYDPGSRFAGLSPISTCSDPIMIGNQARIRSHNILKNGTTFGTVISPKDLSSSMTPEQIADMATLLNNVYKGVKNAGKTMPVGFPVDVKQIGCSPDQLDIPSLFQKAERDICNIFGVPPALLLAPEESTFTNLFESRLQLFLSNIKPFATMMFKEISRHISVVEYGYSGEGKHASLFRRPKMASYIELIPQWDNVPVLQQKKLEAQTSMVKNAKEMFETGVFTTAEIRMVGGHEALKGDNAKYNDMLACDLSVEKENEGEIKGEQPGEDKAKAGEDSGKEKDKAKSDEAAKQDGKA